MRILFTDEELKLGYTIEDKSTSKRTPLDLERFQLLKSNLSQFTFAIYLILILYFKKISKSMKFSSRRQKI